MSETTATKKTAAPAKAPAKKAAAPAKAPAKKAVPAKKAPAKKTKAVIANWRTDYKAGARVKVTRRSGDPVPGRVTEVIKKQTGHFIGVDIGTKAAPNVMWARPSKVRGY